VSLRDPYICLDLHEIFVGVHSNIVEWDNPAAVNPQEPFANLSDPNMLCLSFSIHIQLIYRISWPLKEITCLQHLGILVFYELWRQKKGLYNEQ
jgi:hypothetical protein